MVNQHPKSSVNEIKTSFFLLSKMSVTESQLQQFLASYPNAVLELVPAQQFDIPFASAASIADPGIFWYQALRQSQGYGTRASIQRWPVVWQVYVDPPSQEFFNQLLRRYKLNR